ncbi:MAG: hypothetical protein MMC33_001868 [Icmadophila ericetorum]|nr:hypothetical protein [Icmadophila ericetorum]
MPTLLDLPRELRDQIWEYTVFDWIGVSAYINPNFPPHNSPSQLLQTCQRVHAEVSPILYGVPMFYLFAPHMAKEWINKIGPYNSGLIRNLTLKSSFLSMDANQAGRAIASDAWACVLQAMPNLRELTFDHETNSPNWSDMAFKADRMEYSGALSNALRGLTRLESISYVRGRTCNLEFLKSKPHLQHLRVTHAALVSNVPIDDYCREFRSLKVLQLGKVFEDTRVWSTDTDWQLLNSSATQFLRGLQRASFRSLVIVEDRGGIKVLSMKIKYDLGTATKPTDTSNKDMKRLFSHMPTLSYLGLDGGVDASALAEIPVTVEHLVLSFAENEDTESVATQISRLKERCTNLKCLDIAVSESEVFQVSKDVTKIQGQSLHNALLQLRCSGVHVQYVMRNRTSQRRLKSSLRPGDHIDQSGLIP